MNELPAYWLTFKEKSPDAPRGWPIEKLRALVKRFESDPKTATEWWRIAAYRAARVGDRVYVFKQGRGQRGIFAYGTISVAPEERNSMDEDDGKQWRALISFEKIVDPTRDFLVELPEIEHLLPDSLINAQASGNSVPVSVVQNLENIIANRLEKPVIIVNEEADDESFDPDAQSIIEKAVRAIRLRRGQTAFRIGLLEAYENRCAVTGSNIVAILEAAHICPYMGLSTNHVTNGLLLRSDIHTLYDCRLLTVDPETRKIVIHDSIAASNYGKLSDRRLRSPKDLILRSSKRALEKNFRNFNLT